LLNSHLNMCILCGINFVLVCHQGHDKELHIFYHVLQQKMQRYAFSACGVVTIPVT